MGLSEENVHKITGKINKVGIAIITIYLADTSLQMEAAEDRNCTEYKIHKYTLPPNMSKDIRL